MHKKKARVLITGATGFVGANLARRMIREGFDVFVLTRATSDLWRLRDIRAQINLYRVDLLEYEKLRNIVKKIKPRVIFHLATSGIYADKHASDKELLEANFIGTVNLVKATFDIDYMCFINTGSSSEYGPKIKPMKETDICEPVNMYGITKLASTLYCRHIALFFKKPILTFRLFSPFGPYDDPRRLVPYAIGKALKNHELELGDPESVRDYIYVDDVTALYFKSIDLAAKYRGRVFNVGSGEEQNVRDIVGGIVRLSGSRSLLRWKKVPARSFDKNVSRWQADIAETKKSFRWFPQYNIQDGLKETIRWFKENIHFYE